MRVAIYGGSFDPPHKGHEKIVKEALKQLDIDKLFIIPTWLNPFKKKFFAPPKIRLQWVKKLWKHKKKVKICEYEFKNKKATSAYETICYLEKKYNLSKIYLIIGADNLKTLHKWADFEKLNKKVEFVVATRSKIKIPKNLKKLKINANISSTNLRNKINKHFMPHKILKNVEKFYN